MMTSRIPIDQVIPRVSVVIPLFNKEKYIARSIQSVLGQTVEDFELIIVNDGSTDQSENVVKTFSDSRIRLINQDNGGESLARNRGIDEANCELIAFLDADDEWLPDFLETIIDLQRRFPESGLFGTAYVSKTDDKEVPKIINGINRSRILKSYFDTVTENGFNPINMSSFASYKSLLEKSGLFPPGVKYNGDLYLIGKIVIDHSVAYCPRICSIYHIGSNNLSRDLSTPYYSPLVTLLSASIDDFNCHRETKNSIRRYLDHCLISNAILNIRSGFGEEALELLNKVTDRRFRTKKMVLSVLARFDPRLIKSIQNYKKNWIVK